MAHFATRPLPLQKTNVFRINTSSATIFCVLQILVGITTIWLAFPRFVGALVAVPGDPVIFAARRDQPVGDRALDAAIAARQGALSWTESSSHLREIGAAALELAYRFRDDPSPALDYAEVAERSLSGSLTLAPVDTHSWARLAVAKWMTGNSTGEIVGALRASILTGRYEPRMTEWRLRLVLAMWPYIGVGDRPDFEDQFWYLWNDDPEALVGLSLDERWDAIIINVMRDAAALDRLETMRGELRRNDN